MCGFHYHFLLHSLFLLTAENGKQPNLRLLLITRSNGQYWSKDSFELRKHIVKTL